MQKARARSFARFREAVKTAPQTRKPKRYCSKTTVVVPAEVSDTSFKRRVSATRRGRAPFRVATEGISRGEGNRPKLRSADPEVVLGGSSCPAARLNREEGAASGQEKILPGRKEESASPAAAGPQRAEKVRR